MICDEFIPFALIGGQIPVSNINTRTYIHAAIAIAIAISYTSYWDGEFKHRNGMILYGGRADELYYYCQRNPIHLKIDVYVSISPCSPAGYYVRATLAS